MGRQAFGRWELFPGEGLWPDGEIVGLGVMSLGYSESWGLGWARKASDEVNNRGLVSRERGGRALLLLFRGRRGENNVWLCFWNMESWQ